jgi:hypothetical protein
MMTTTGQFRVYFNRHQAAPLVWCVATDCFEVAVATVAISAPVRAIYEPKATPDHEDGKPSAFLEVFGTLIIDGDGARIVAAR